MMMPTGAKLLLSPGCLITHFTNAPRAAAVARRHASRVISFHGARGPRPYMLYARRSIFEVFEIDIHRGYAAFYIT